MSVRRTRNDSDLWYCLLNPSASHIVLDEDGNETGEIIPEYESAVQMWANISPAMGQAQVEQFGSLEGYDKVLFTKDMDCPIDENTLLFIDKQPEYTSVVTHRVVDVSTVSEIVSVTYQQPANDYVVKRVAKSLNAIAIAVRKVNVS